MAAQRMLCPTQPFLLYSNSARPLRLLRPASVDMDLQRMVAENQNNPAFLQDIIRMLTQTQSDAGSVHPDDASNATPTSSIFRSRMLHRPPSLRPHQQSPSARQSRPFASARTPRTSHRTASPSMRLKGRRPSRPSLHRKTTACPSPRMSGHRGLRSRKRREKSSVPERSCLRIPGMTA